MQETLHFGSLISAWGMKLTFDLIIRGGHVVDGTGAKAFAADIAVANGRIARIGHIDEDAEREYDASGLIVAPGFIDVHTHYDAQIEWDPLLTPSCWHGVTTVLVGNCGFTLAPAKPEDVDWLIGMLTRVEGMSREALEAGLAFKGGNFGDYWARFQGRLGINVGAYVGHSAVRRYVMGDEASVRAATPNEIEAMKELVRDAMKQGAIGFSTSQLSMHVGEDGREVPSNFASHEEVVALCGVLAEFDHGAIEIISRSLPSGYDELDRKLIRDIGRASGKPIELGESGYHNGWETVRDFTNEMAEQGIRIHPMLTLNKLDLHVRLFDTIIFDGNPALRDVLCLPHPDRMAALRDPKIRATWLRALTDEQGGTHPFDKVFVESTTIEANKSLVGRQLGDIAAERGENVIECFIDLSLSEDLKMTFVLLMDEETEREWRRVNKELILNGPLHVIGASDAGAHLNSFVGSDYTTRLISEWVPETLSLEAAIHRLTGEPATNHGIRDRGLLKEGHKADIICFKQDELRAKPGYFTEDFPAGAGRYVCDADGYKLMVVNGKILIKDGVHSGATPGEFLAFA